jgi:hypothetical protein
MREPNLCLAEVKKRFYRYAGMWLKVLGIVGVDFDTMDRVLDRYSAFVKYLKKMGVQSGSTPGIH